MSALDSTVCNNELWRRKGQKPHEYIRSPFLQIAKDNKQLSEKEKQKEVDLFFARENARRINWKRNQVH